MRAYESFEQIEADLKRLSLEKQIGLEELKLVKSDFQDSLKPLSILAGVAKFASKYGALVLLKKIFK
ncbi:hypothetical protein [Polaribacter sp. Hel_I_88]|uniref:hypothetical protein n=1 Tax=Polaribacter sp. Hel_I_88 TaxID=1250006 RepID=UPI0004788B07|nr:hypothetical protein [Polaribacter sp. Hel_I_88]